MNTIEEEFKRAYDQAIRLLARRAHSEWELQHKLLQGKTTPEVANRVCERCQELGYLDDTAFALARAQYRLLHGHYGPAWVRAELRSLHINEHAIQQALDMVLAENDVVHLAAVALAKRFGSTIDFQSTDHNAPDTATSAVWNETETHEYEAGGLQAATGSQCARHRAKEKKRRYDFLARRGFSDRTIWQVLE